MKLIIEGEAKEIAALVLEIQERQEKVTNHYITVSPTQGNGGPITWGSVTAKGVPLSGGNGGSIIEKVGSGPST